MSFSRTLTLLSTGLLLATAPAMAGEVTFTMYSKTNPPATSTGPAQPITSETFNLPLFNSMLGTLTAVTLSLSSNVSIVAQVTNISSTNTDAFTNSIATLPFTLSDSFGTSLNGSETAGPGAGSVAPNSVVTSAYTNTTYANTASVAQANFGSYQSNGGGGTVAVNFVTGTVQASGNGVPGQTFFGGYGNSDATVSVIYDYSTPTGVPEPASMALLGAGLLGTGLFRRFRR